MNNGQMGGGGDISYSKTADSLRVSCKMYSGPACQQMVTEWKHEGRAIVPEGETHLTVSERADICKKVEHYYCELEIVF
jgi:hypothetical protein